MTRWQLSTSEIAAALWDILEDCALRTNPYCPRCDADAPEEDGAMVHEEDCAVTQIEKVLAWIRDTQTAYIASLIK